MLATGRSIAITSSVLPACCAPTLIKCMYVCMYVCMYCMYVCMSALPCLAFSAKPNI